MERRLEDLVFDSSIPVAEKRRAARVWLDDWKRSLLPELRTHSFPKSKYADRVTLIIYFFMPTEDTFDLFEFSILQTWKVVGMLPTKIVVNQRWPAVERFEGAYKECVEVQVESSLVTGDVRTMSSDCIERLWTRFQTDYCLVVQDDGFPIDVVRDDSGRIQNATLGDFIGKYDYVGGPSVRDVPAQYWVDLTRCVCMNGGLSLRSRRICRDVARQWRFWRKFVRIDSPMYSEDAIYSHVCCRNPLYRLRNRFASSKTARRFSLPDFDGVVDIRRSSIVPFGVHGPTAIWQMSQRGIFA